MSSTRAESAVDVDADDLTASALIFGGGITEALTTFEPSKLDGYSYGGLSERLHE
jgi:hypothetical protein